MQEATSNELTEVQQGGALAVCDYGDDIGGGFENQSKADIAVPFIALLQTNSPQVENGDLKAGDLFNTVTEEVFAGDTGFEFVPAVTEHVVVEWVPRNQGGGGGAGFVARHDPDSEIVREAIERRTRTGSDKLLTEEGNELVDTFYVYGIICEDGEPVEMAILAFTSTKIKVYKRWNTRVNMFTVRTPDGKKVRPPLFAHSVRVTSTRQENAKGPFRNLVLTPSVDGDLGESLLRPDDPRYKAAKDCRDMIAAGTARADYDAASKGEGSGSDNDSPF